MNGTMMQTMAKKMTRTMKTMLAAMMQMAIFGGRH